MTKLEIQNEVLKGYHGKILKDLKKDINGELVYKPFKCRGGCGAEAFTNLTLYSEHLALEHPQLELDSKKTPQPVPERIDQRTPGLIIGMLNTVQAAGQGDPLFSIRKPNDGKYAFHISRKASNAEDTEESIKLLEKEYVWLRGLLSRNVPLSKDAKEKGEEPQSVVTFIYGLNDWVVLQALCVVGDRGNDEVWERE